MTEDKLLAFAIAANCALDQPDRMLMLEGLRDLIEQIIESGQVEVDALVAARAVLHLDPVPQHSMSRLKVLCTALEFRIARMKRRLARTHAAEAA